MTVKKAVGYFIGSGGNPRLNCSRAVAQAFKDKFSLSDEFILSLAFMGFGKAPGGVCGALYAVKTILQQVGNDKNIETDKLFSEYTGSKYCADIRQMKKVSCVGCVKKAASILDKDK